MSDESTKKYIDAVKTLSKEADFEYTNNPEKFISDLANAITIIAEELAKKDFSAQKFL